MIPMAPSAASSRPTRSRATGPRPLDLELVGACFGGPCFDHPDVKIDAPRKPAGAPPGTQAGLRVPGISAACAALDDRIADPPRRR